MRASLTGSAGAFVALAPLLLPSPACAAQPPRPSNAEIFFRMDNPCPATGQAHGACKGYLIDRIIPIVCGGAEAPENMQWQTLAEAKAKDRWDRIGCRKGLRLVLPGQSKSVTEAFAMGDAPAPVQSEPLPAQ
jgi:hypothetical protein